MELLDLQKRLDDGFEVAKVQIWLTKRHEKLNNKEVEKVGCRTVREYVSMLEAEGRKSMGARVKPGYDDLVLCTVGTIKNDKKTLLFVYNEIPADLSISYE